MVIEESVLNLTEFISVLPPSIIERIEGLVIILKAIGVAVIVYIVYIVGMGFVNLRRAKRIKNIEKRVDSIDRKLNILLKVKNKKVK